MDRARSEMKHYRNGAISEDQSFLFSNSLNAGGAVCGIGMLSAGAGGGELLHGASNNASDTQIPGAIVSADDNTCVLCFKNVEIYSIGDCDHPVCHECSTRMLVLCQQNECPICRQVLSKVSFAKLIQV